jgi:hypothetical protein
MRKMKRRILLIGMLIICVSFQAKTQNFGTWIELEFRKDFLEKFNFNITPELRLKDQFQVDEYMIQGQLSYDAFSFLSVAGAYRIGTEIKNKGNVSFHRIAFDLQASQNINRFSASLRNRFTNTADSGSDEAGYYYRPRLKVDYNIRGRKFTPFATYELFHNLKTEKLHKSRMDIGFTQRLGNLHRVGLYYRLHDYFTDKESIHILGIDYRLKF